MLWATTWSEVRSRYVGTIGGLVWTLIYPLVFLAIYAVIYTFVFRVQLPNIGRVEYLFVIFSGLVPFLGFAEAIGNGVHSIVANKSLIKNTLFPIELLPVKAALASSVSMVVSLGILVVALAFHGGMKTTQLFLIPLLLINFLFTLGVVWILATVNVFMRDLSNMVPIAVLFLMLISPIAYTPDLVPGNLASWLAVNPLYYLIMLYREVLLGNGPDAQTLLTFSAISLFVFTIGFQITFRLKGVFSEYV